MSNKKEVKGTAPKSNTPMLIIAGVLLVAVLGGWWMYNSSTSTTKTNSNSNSTAKNTQPANKAPGIPPNAPAGANPPNQSGSQTASVTVEEFADFQCGSCAAAHPIMNEIKSTYGSRIRFIFRNYPLAIPAHDKSYEAAVAAEAAGMQGQNKFWDLQNLLFNNQQAWTAAPTYKAMWKDYATKIGLDIGKWENDMAGIAAKSRVDADMARGKAIGVSSTPSFYINGNAVPFAEATVTGLKKIIDAELASSSPAAVTAPAANAAAPANAANASK